MLLALSGTKGLGLNNGGRSLEWMGMNKRNCCLWLSVVKRNAAPSQTLLTENYGQHLRVMWWVRIWLMGLAVGLLVMRIFNNKKHILVVEENI